MKSSSPVSPLSARNQADGTPSALAGDNDHAELRNWSAACRQRDCNAARSGLPPPLRLLVPLFVLGAVLPPLRAQTSAADALQRALHFADLYNWSDAAGEFTEAEKLFLAAGDQRNALFARLGKTRSTAEQRNLPSTSAELGAELDTNPGAQRARPAEGPWLRSIGIFAVVPGVLSCHCLWLGVARLEHPRLPGDRGSSVLHGHPGRLSGYADDRSPRVHP